MSWDDSADGWDEVEGVRAYSQAAFECLIRVCTERRFHLDGARTCDFGCGTGLLTEKFAPVCASVVAVDTSVAMIDQLRSKIARLGLTNVQTTTDEVEHAVRHNATLFDSPCDLIVCSSVCAFLDDYPATTATLVRLLRPGGLFVQWDWEVDRHADEAHGLTREQVKEALSSAGLEAIEIDSAFELAIGGTTKRPLMGVGQVPGKPPVIEKSL